MPRLDGRNQRLGIQPRAARVLEMLAVEPAVPCLPEVVAAGTSPLILVTR
jgi:hypothetical protein